jgi:LysM repeat protein
MTKKRGFIKGALVSTLLTGVLILSPGNTEAAQSYSVQSGDSLWKIANNFSISISQLKNYNNLSNDEIWVGQKLVIPGANDNYYTVVPGDSLYLIAQHYGTTVDKLMSINGLTNHNLYVGQVLTLPAGNAPVPAPAPTNPSTGWQVPSGVSLHYVQSGDSLGSIAQKYRSTVDAISKSNRLKGDLITPGMPLFVPVSSSKPVSINAPQGTKKAGYGELLGWEYANWLFNHGSTGVIKDLQTGVTFNISRIGGGNHADCEPLTVQDTAIMKNLFGGSWSWQVRPVILIYQGREIAASMAGMPHGFDTIGNNNFVGMFDVHFLGSRTHNTNAEDPQHQQSVLRAAGN